MRETEVAERGEQLLYLEDLDEVCATRMNGAILFGSTQYLGISSLGIIIPSDSEFRKP